MKKINSFYYKNNRLQQIRGFVNVVQCGGITKAAEKMNLVQSTVSCQISKLETDLETKLFKKDGIKLKLTEAGEKLYKKSVPHLYGIDNLFEDFLSEQKHEDDNCIRIAGYHSFISWTLPKYIKEFININQDADILINSINMDNAIDKLRKREVDIICYANKNIPHDLEILKTFKFNPTLLISKHNPLLKLKRKINAEDISKENVLLIDREKIVSTYNYLFDRYNIKSNIKFVNADWEMIRFFVQQNIGVSFFANVDAEKDKADDIVGIDISHIFPYLEYYIIGLKIPSQKNLVNSFIQSCQ